MRFQYLDVLSIVGAATAVVSSSNTSTAEPCGQISSIIQHFYANDTSMPSSNMLAFDLILQQTLVIMSISNPRSQMHVFFLRESTRT